MLRPRTTFVLDHKQTSAFSGNKNKVANLNWNSYLNSKKQRCHIEDLLKVSCYCVASNIIHQKIASLLCLCQPEKLSYIVFGMLLTRCLPKMPPSTESRQRYWRMLTCKSSAGNLTITWSHHIPAIVILLYSWFTLLKISW